MSRARGRNAGFPQRQRRRDEEADAEADRIGQRQRIDAGRRAARSCNSAKSVASATNAAIVTGQVRSASWKTGFNADEIAQ